jgi:lysine biosynthesis protein LysW
MSDETLYERPVTACPLCAGEIDLTYADPGDTITCTVCGAELVVLSLDPPDVDVAEG